MAVASGSVRLTFRSERRRYGPEDGRAGSRRHSSRRSHRRAPSGGALPGSSGAGSLPKTATKWSSTTSLILPHKGIGRGIAGHASRVGQDLFPPDESRVNAEVDHVFEKATED